jgi:hypothetical protein
MGIFSGSGSTMTTSTEGYKPAMQSVDSALGYMQDMPYMQAYGGPYAAAMNPMLSQAYGSMFDTGRGMLPGAQDMRSQGMQGYSDYLGKMLNTGPRQFQYDQGLYDQTMQNIMPGLQSSAALQGKLSSRALDSNLGQLMGAAGTSGQFGTNLSSKLSQGAASATALSQEALQRNLQNLYMGGANMANRNAYGAGMANFGAGQNFDRNMLSGYGNMTNMGASAMKDALGFMGQAGMGQQRYDQFATDMERKQFMDRQSIPLQDAMARAQLGSSIGKAFGTTTQKSKNDFSLFDKIGMTAQLGQSLAGMGSGLGGFFGGGGGSPYGFGQGQVGFSDPMQGWWM